jgi:NADH:ubiquinone oxidoreductase subunit 4 (subunit M)
MASESVLRSFYYPGFFLGVIIVLMVMLFCTFGRINLFSFYLFFESSIVPTIFLILGWGYQPERLQAGIYLLFYTLLASLPLLERKQKMEAICSSETLVATQQTTWRHIPEDDTLYNNCCGNLKS